MLIKERLVEPLNKQVAMEFGAEMQYIAIAAYFDAEGLPELASHFFRQAEEERSHAMKIVQFMLDAGAVPVIPGLGAPKNGFGSAHEAVKFALDQEMEVTHEINHLVSLALEVNDHTADTFLRWFVSEQVEEVASMTNLLQIIKHAGSNLLWVEDYVRRNGPQAATGALSADG